MPYLERFTFPSQGSEEAYLNGVKRTNYISFYPFRVLSTHRLETVRFDPITIFYGDNGSGKSTALNIIANKIKAKRFSSYNTTDFVTPYLSMCEYNLYGKPKEILVITSDAVFDELFNIKPSMKMSI